MIDPRKIVGGNSNKGVKSVEGQEITLSQTSFHLNKASTPNPDSKISFHLWADLLDPQGTHATCSGSP